MARVVLHAAQMQKYTARRVQNTVYRRQLCWLQAAAACARADASSAQPLPHRNSGISGQKREASAP